MSLSENRFAFTNASLNHCIVHRLIVNCLSLLRLDSLAVLRLLDLHESPVLQLLHVAGVQGVETAPVEAARTNHSEFDKTSANKCIMPTFSSTNKPKKKRKQGTRMHLPSVPATRMMLACCRQNSTAYSTPSRSRTCARDHSELK
jgi:hypothetical protein